MSPASLPDPEDDESSAAYHDRRLDGTYPRSASDRPAWRKKYTFQYGSWRHALGMTCLLITVFLWTASNFLASVCPI